MKRGWILLILEVKVTGQKLKQPLEYNRSICWVIFSPNQVQFNHDEEKPIDFQGQRVTMDN